jgi:hypothetical protein
MTDRLRPGKSKEGKSPKPKPEEWELKELTIGDPECSTVGMIAIFGKPGEPLEWETFPPPKPKLKAR